MKQNKLLYEGKGKKIYKSEDADKVIVFFKDDLTAYQGKKKSEFKGKGEICCHVSSLIFRYLHSENIYNHWLKDLSPLEILCLKVNIFPLEVVVRNRIAGSTAQRLGIEEGLSIPEPLLEYYYKRDDLDDPFISEEQILKLSLIDKPSFLTQIRTQAFLINKKLKEFFLKANLDLVDFKMEFGLSLKGDLILADDITPDSCRLWDIESQERLDKDRFRRGWGQVEESYKEIEARVFQAWSDKLKEVSVL